MVELKIIITPHQDFILLLEIAQIVDIYNITIKAGII
jgi:hypothetical protein